MLKRKVGRPLGSGNYHQRLNLYLPVLAIEALKEIALKEGFVTKIGRYKGEHNISAWLNSIYKPKE